MLRDLDWSACPDEGGSRSKLIMHLASRWSGKNLSKQEQFAKFLGESKMVRMQDGFYRLVVDYRKYASPPAKVIDLRGKYSSYKQAFGFAAVNAIAKGMVAMVPALLLVSTVAAMLERLFNLIEASYLTRHTMALNLIVDAQNE